jgi:sensor domain CHASE-containing protein
VIHNIVWRRTQLLAVIISIIWYRYLCMMWYYLDIELQASRRSTRSVKEYLQNKAKGCVRLAIAIHPL